MRSALNFWLDSRLHVVAFVHTALHIAQHHLSQEVTMHIHKNDSHMCGCMGEGGTRGAPGGPKGSKREGDLRQPAPGDATKTSTGMVFAHNRANLKKRGKHKTCVFSS